MNPSQSSPCHRRRKTGVVTDELTLHQGSLRLVLVWSRTERSAVVQGELRGMAAQVLPNKEAFRTDKSKTITIGKARIESRRGPVRNCDVRELLLLCADVVESEAFPKWRPRPLRPEPTDDPVEYAAETMQFSEFEAKIMVNGFDQPWDQQLAEKFNKYISRVDGHGATPIVCDFPVRLTRLGEHRPDRIRLCDELPDVEKYRVLLHEIAHYRVQYHRRSFVRELARVYRLWLKFVASRPSK